MKKNNNIISKLRKQHDLTVDEFCKKIQDKNLKLNRSIIWKWEHGVQNVSLKYAKKICEVFNITIFDF
jgi:transcriptional regulator with XRE-family HTH domain